MVLDAFNDVSVEAHLDEQYFRLLQVQLLNNVWHTGHWVSMYLSLPFFILLSGIVFLPVKEAEHLLEQKLEWGAVVCTVNSLMQFLHTLVPLSFFLT